jgi:hypothetical protein
MMTADLIDTHAHLAEYKDKEQKRLSLLPVKLE